MTTDNRTRQPFLDGLANGRTKSVPVPEKRNEDGTPTQKGLPIGHDWKIAADEMNVTIYKRRGSKTGKESWQVQGYYSTIGNALIGLVNQGVRDTELTSIRAVEEKIAELKRDILKLAAGR